MEAIYKTYCGVFPLSPDFKAFGLSISLSEVGTKDKEEEIRFHVSLDVFLYFISNTSKVLFEITKPFTEL